MTLTVWATSNVYTPSGLPSDEVYLEKQPMPRQQILPMTADDADPLEGLHQSPEYEEGS